MATALTFGMAHRWSWSAGGSLVLGMAVSVASTVVLIRALVARQALESSQGRLAVGWLVFEDLFSVLILVILPVLAVSLGGSADHTAVGPHNDTLRDALLREGDSVLTFVLRRLDVSQTVPVLIAAAMTTFSSWRYWPSP
jgi:monovalent cation:H+ antiporter-2, CPA2 family